MAVPDPEQEIVRTALTDEALEQAPRGRCLPAEAMGPFVREPAESPHDDLSDVGMVVSAVPGLLYANLQRLDALEQERCSSIGVLDSQAQQRGLVRVVARHLIATLNDCRLRLGHQVEAEVPCLIDETADRVLGIGAYGD